jgi:hypothetical protein
MDVGSNDCGNGHSCPAGKACSGAGCTESYTPPPGRRDGPLAKNPESESLFSKRVPSTTGLFLFLFCLYAAIKETVKAKVPAPYKVITTFVIAGVEWAIYAQIGVSPDDPKIVDVVAMSAPLLVTTGVLWGVSSTPNS